MDANFRGALPGVSLVLLTVTLLLPAAALAQNRGMQLTPDSQRILVNKDVGSERWAITQNQDDATVTGNVFRTGGGAPAFIFCQPSGSSLQCFGADSCTSGGLQRGIQNTPDGKHILVNKDVGSERWAISRNLNDGTVTGNVFRSDGGAPAFIYCTSLGGNNYRCNGANACGATPCVGGFSFLADVTVSGDFFSVPAPCGNSYSFIGNVQVPQDFFSPSVERSDTNALTNDIQAQAKSIIQIGVAVIGSAQSVENRAEAAGQSTIPCSEGGFYVETSNSIEAFDCQEDGLVTNGFTSYQVDDVTGEVLINVDEVSVRDVFTGEEFFYTGSLQVFLDGDFYIINGTLGVASNTLGTFFVDFFDLTTDVNLVPITGAFVISVEDGFGAFANLSTFTYEALGFQIERVTLEFNDGSPTETWIFAFTLCDPCVSGDTCAEGLDCFPCDSECTGDTNRCSVLDDFVDCADGFF